MSDPLERAPEPGESLRAPPEDNQPSPPVSLSHPADDRPADDGNDSATPRLSPHRGEKGHGGPPSAVRRPGHRDGTDVASAQHDLASRRVVARPVGAGEDESAMARLALRAACAAVRGTVSRAELAAGRGGGRGGAARVTPLPENGRRRSGTRQVVGNRETPAGAGADDEDCGNGGTNATLRPCGRRPGLVVDGESARDGRGRDRRRLRVGRKITRKELVEAAPGARELIGESPAPSARDKVGVHTLGRR